MNLKEIKELIEMLPDTYVSKIEIERSGLKVRIRKGGDVTYHPTMPRMEYPPHAIVAPTIVETSPDLAEPREVEPEKSNQITVTAPIVGSFYRSSSPDKPPYVEVGDVVKKGQILCIIEAMKLMNEIESETAGKIVQVVVENGSPVEYGQPLFVIEPM